MRKGYKRRHEQRLCQIGSSLRRQLRDVRPAGGRLAGASDGASASFQLLQTGQLGGVWATNFSALLTTNVPGVSYQFSAVANASLQFYRVRSP